jgi:hypothetical protein
MNSGTKNFSKKRVILFLETIDNPFYYQYLYAISKKISDSEGHLQIVSLDEAFSIHNLRSLLRFLRRRRALRLVEMDLLSSLSNISVSHQSSKPTRNVKKYTRLTLQPLRLTDELREVFPEYKYLGSSLHSLSTSALTMSSDPMAKIVKYRNVLRRACSSYITYFQIANESIKEFNPELLILLNGRTPEQAVFREVAEKMNLSWLCLEHGAKPGKSYFLEDFQTQDRLRTQEVIRSCSQNFSTDDLDRIMTEIDGWIQRQSSDHNQNPTLSLRDLSNPKLPAGQEFFPIFTSSIDEEMSCPNWSNDNVRSLTDRTIKAAKLAALKGLYPVVVIHPNTLNKKWHDLSLIYSELKKQDVEVSLPWDQISSYEYLEMSRVIATWRSTIGLEAVLKGKEVVLLSDTVYDELIDFQSLSSINFSNLVTKRRVFLDIQLAKLTIHFYANFGYDLFVDLSRAEIDKIQSYEKLLPLGGIVRSIRNKVRKYFRPLRVYGATPREVFDFLSLFMPRQKVDSVMKFLITNYRY